MDIDSMEAGPEMDALVAERIYPDIFTECPIHQSRFCCGRLCRRWSIDDRAAFQLVDKMLEDGWAFSLGHTIPIPFEGKEWLAWFHPLKESGREQWTVYNGRGDTRALAICRAALKAVQEDATDAE